MLVKDRSCSINAGAAITSLQTHWNFKKMGYSLLMDGKWDNYDIQFIKSKLKQ